MDTLDAALLQLGFCCPRKIQMGFGFSGKQNCWIAGSGHLAAHFRSDLVAAGPDRGSDPRLQIARILVEIVEGLLDDASDQAAPPGVDRRDGFSALDRDGYAVGGSHGKDQVALSGDQGVSLAAKTLMVGLYDR